MQNLKQTARLTGLGYLVIFISGFFANFYIIEQLLVEGNSLETTRNIVENQAWFFWGIASFFIMVAMDIILAWPLYLLVKSVSVRLSSISSLLRVVNGLVFALALSHLFQIYFVMGPSDQSPGQIMYHMETFNIIWSYGLIIFGIHLLFLGYLIRKSPHFPVLIGWLLQLAGVAYLIDSSAIIWYPHYENYKFLFEGMVVAAGIIGELSLTIYLLTYSNSPMKKRTSIASFLPLS